MTLKVPPSKNLLEDLASVLSGDTKKFQSDSPSNGIEMGEQILGTLEDPIARALWNLSRKIKETLKEDCVEIKDSIDPEDRMMIEKVYRTLDNANDIASVCNKLFWIRVQMSFPQAHKMGLTFGVRNGWRVVVMKATESPVDILRSFLSPD